eukprot:365725-Chlamydomonas_euryale.AAC.57
MACKGILSGQALAFLTRPSVTNAEAAEGVGRLQWERTGAKPLGLLDGVSVRQATAYLTASHTAARARRHQEFVQLALRPAGL